MQSVRTLNKVKEPLKKKFIQLIDPQLELCCQESIDV